MSKLKHFYHDFVNEYNILDKQDDWFENWKDLKKYLSDVDFDTVDHSQIIADSNEIDFEGLFQALISFAIDHFHFFYGGFTTEKRPQEIGPYRDEAFDKGNNLKWKFEHHQLFPDNFVLSNVLRKVIVRIRTARSHLQRLLEMTDRRF